jgi:taurine dioxygenase
MSVEIQRLSYGLGAQISGFDLTRPLDAETVAEIRQAWLQYQILLIRGLEISPDQQMRFTNYFGQQAAYPLEHYRHPNFPEIFLLSNMTDDGKISQTADAAREWHTDMSWSIEPALGSILRCIEIPEVGGSTIFSNAYMAYERLSPAYRRMIDQLYAVHEVFNPKNAVIKNQQYAAKLNVAQTEEMRKANPPVIQPVVRLHPETGRRALYVCEGVTTRLVGCTEAESAPILEFLSKEAARVEYTYRHHWKPNDIIMWDNRCTLHMAVPDNDHQQRRLMHRTTVLGTGSGEYAPVDDTHWYDERDKRSAVRKLT